MAKVITIAQQKGGAGKTSLAIHLSVGLLGREAKVGLVDLDPQESLTAWYRLRRDAYGPEIDLILSSAAGWKAQTEIDRIRRGVDFVVIDSPPHAETAARLAIRAADLVVVPVQLSPMDIWASRPTLDMIERERRAALVVLNRVPPRSRLADELREKLEREGLPIASASLGNRLAYAASLMSGLGITEHAPSSAAGEELDALLSEILSLLTA